MTEAQWLACEDPDTMREFLRGEASNRKLRLFVCACCRGIWDQFTEEQGRKTVEVAERMADGQAEPGEVAAARREIEEINRIKGERWANDAQQSEAAYLYGGLVARAFAALLPIFARYINVNVKVGLVPSPEKWRETPPVDDVTLPSRW